MTKIETENLQQKQEIASMKNTIGEDRRMIGDLNSRIERLLEAIIHDLVEENNDQEFFTGRKKIPVRILHPQIYQ